MVATEWRAGCHVHGCSGEHATGWASFAIRGVDVQLIADPGLLVSLGIALDTDIAVPRQLGQHRGHGHAALTFDPAWRFCRTNLALARTTTLAFWVVWPAPDGPISPASRGASIAVLSRARCVRPGEDLREVSLISASCSLDGRALHGEGGEGAREMSTRSAPRQHAASRTNSAVSYRPTASSISRPGGWKVEFHFRTKARASAARSRWRAAGAAGKPLQAGQQHPRSAPFCRTLWSPWCPLSGPPAVSSIQSRKFS